MRHLFILMLYFVLLAGNIFAQQTKQLVAPGLLQSVEVLRDKWGVNHIYAQNQHDLFFSQGYCAAEDRLFQFEIWRRQVTGTMSELTGIRDLQRDIAMRLFTYRGNMDAEFSQYHPQGEAIIRAFVDGVNAYISHVLQHKEELPDEFRLLDILPQKWTPEIVISRHQGVLVNVLEELNIGRAVAKVGVDTVMKLQWFHPGDPDINLDSSINVRSLDKDVLALYNAFRSDVVFTKNELVINNQNHAITQPVKTSVLKISTEEEGSNNWVIAGSRTTDGYAMVGSDPHRKISIPSLRYIVHLNAPGWNVMGAGEPYTPGVAIGHNAYGAWGITIHQTDIEDLYVYDLNSSDVNEYWYKGKWVRMRQIHEVIAVKNRGSINVTLNYTIHGPVTFIDTLNRKAYAIKAGWLMPGNAPYLASLRIGQSKDWTSFQKACSYSFLPSLNLVWADKKGNIGWQVTGNIPIRKNFSGLVPVPGDGRFEWSGMLPILERPHAYNPSKGYIATANENLVPKGFAHADAAGFSWPDAYRANRVNEVLSADSAITMQKMKALQTDYISIAARLLVPMLASIKMNEPLLSTAKDYMLAWDYNMTIHSVAAGIYNKWEREMMTQAKEQFFPAAVKQILALQTTRLIEWLQHPAMVFSKDSLQQRDEFLRVTFEAAVNKMQAQLGNNISQWQFGQDKYKHSQFIHPFSEFLDSNWQHKLNTVSLPRGGYGHTPGATGNQDNQGNGASFRYLANIKDWDETLMINTPGQSGNPSSPWYKNLFEMWAKDEYFPAYFSKEKITKVLAEKTLLLPKKNNEN